MVKKKTPNPSKKKPILKKSKTLTPVIGVGASAGGLDAINKLFKHMPEDMGVAFVIIQHLDPNHKSILTELVQRFTSMKVNQITSGMKVMPNCVYIIPPGFEVNLHINQLILNELPKPRTFRLPIDNFFKSLAQNRNDRAIGIVLSGTGTDGTLGVREIKSENGIVFVQSPMDAKYDGMPVSAISSGIVDYILDADKIAEKIQTYLQYINDSSGNIPIPQEYSNNIVSKIFRLLFKKIGHDFTQYKPNTIIRRIERRMKIAQVSKIDAYYDLIKKDTDELDLLFKDFLIGVTSFFRDKDAFGALYKNIFPEIIKNKNGDAPLRIWIPGCSTGEEAYTIVILLKEFISANDLHDFKFQVFATDIDLKSIEIARQAIYPESISADVPQKYLKKYFFFEKNSYIVNKFIRDHIVFAEQSVVKDPPFSKVDLISCRNLLIYMTNVLQEKVISSFHYALNPEGYLFLGTSEALGKNKDLFNAIDNKWKVYQKNNIISNRLYMPNLPVFKPSFKDAYQQEKLSAAKEKITLKQLVESQIIKHYTPSAVLVNVKFDILYLKGNTSAYLEPVEGVAHMNVIDMAKQDIRLKLNVALSTAVRENKPISVEKLHIKIGNQYKFINIHISPIATFEDTSPLYLIVFEDITEKEFTIDNELTDINDKDLDYIKTLELELRQTKEHLQTIIEEAETTNEELKATNEEMQSSNEELQSTNEELETSKEELQSINEELITVNTEHQIKIEELSNINNDVSNLLANTEIATIFLDLDLKIKKFTPKVTDFINLIPTDINRHIENFVNRLDYPSFYDDIKHVVNTLNITEKEIDSVNRSYICRLMPYRTLDNVVTGVVVTFTDITALKSRTKKLQESEEKYRVIYQHSPDPIIIHDLEMNIISVNEKAIEEFGYDEKEFLKKSVYDIHPKEEIPKSNEVLALMHQKESHQVIGQFIRKDKSIFLAVATPCKYQLDGNPIIHVVIRNIEGIIEIKSELKETRVQSELNMLKFEKSFEYASIGKALVSTSGKWLKVNKALCEFLGYREKELLKKTFQDLTHADDLEKDLKYVEKMLNSEIKTYQMEKRYLHKKGHYVWALLSVSMVPETAHHSPFFISQIVDIHEMKLAKQIE